MRGILTVALLVVASLALAQTKEPAEKMFWMGYRMPQGFFSNPGSDGSEGKSQEKSEVLPATEVDMETDSTFDAREFLERSGVPFPAGSKAVLYRDPPILQVFNTKENLELVDSIMLASLGPCGTGFLQNEYTLVALKLSPAAFAKPVISVANLKAEAGNSWREINVLKFVSKSGIRVQASAAEGVENTIISSTPTTDGKPPAGMSGSSCETENVVGPDGETIDVRFFYRFRGVPDGNKKPLEVSISSESTVGDGAPQILHLTAISGVAGSALGQERVDGYALVLRVTQERTEAVPFEFIRRKAP